MHRHRIYISEEITNNPLKKTNKGYNVLSCSIMSDFLLPHGLQPARLLCPWGFSRQEYWIGLPCPPPGDLPTGSSLRDRTCISHVSYIGRQTLYH